MIISAKVVNSPGAHEVTLRSGDQTHSIVIPPKPKGLGSSANGGELLFLALATCYCNDIYREAAKTGIEVQRVEVEVHGEFGAEGEPASNVRYRARVTSSATVDEIEQLMVSTDKVAEIQNSLRAGTPVHFERAEAVAI